MKFELNKDFKELFSTLPMSSTGLDALRLDVTPEVRAPNVPQSTQPVLKNQFTPK